MPTEHVATYCRVCEPACGLLATVTDGELTELRADPEHPVSRGFACPRGTAGIEIHRDPDRLDHPMERVDGRCERRAWNDALTGLAADLREVVDRYGPEAVGVYVGNPSTFNSLLGYRMPDVLRRLGVTRLFGSGTQDCANKFAASAAVYGSRVVHPIPDVRNADAILLIGSNWRVSKGSFISIPNAYRELMEASRRGAKVWFVNPRSTESANERTGTTVPIKPDTDLYFLAALLHEIDTTVGFSPEAVARSRGLDDLRSYVARYPAERVAPVCGLPAEQIRSIAREFAAAPRAAAHMSTGVNMGRQGTLAYWLLQVLVHVTDNLDAEGGNIPAPELYPAAAKAKSEYASDLLQTEFGQVFRGERPGALLADYVLDADQPIRALVVVAGNPLLSIPGEARLRQAFEHLDWMAVIDIYPSATSEYAKWLLPATDQFEREDVNVSLVGMQADPFVHYTPRVVDARHERREEWWILERLAQELGQPSVLDPGRDSEDRWARVDRILAAGGLGRTELAASGRGVPLPGGLTPGRMFETHVHTPDGRLDCHPAAFAEAIERSEQIFEELLGEDPGQLRLISRRDSRMHNSWYSNVPGMKRGRRDRNRLGLNPEDAERLAIADGGDVVVRSAWGELEMTAELDPALRAGVVSAEHGWGAQPSLGTSASRPGVNVNVLMPSGPGTFDPLSNMAQLTGVAVEVVPVNRPARRPHPGGSPAR